MNSTVSNGGHRSGVRSANGQRQDWRLIIFAIAISASLVYGGYRLWDLLRSDTIVPSKETTYFTGPLLPDGQVDLVQAYNDAWNPNVSPDKNAATVLVKLTCADSESCTDKFREEIAAEMGMDLAEFSGPAIQGLYQFIERNHWEALPTNDDQGWRSAIVQPVTTAKWKSADHPLVAEWLDENADALAQLHTVRDCSVYFRPIVLGGEPNLLSAALPDGTVARDVSEMLAARALRDTGPGDISQPIEDLQLAHQVSVWMMQGPELVLLVVGAASGKCAFSAEQALLAGGHLNAGQARRLGDFIARLPEPIPLSVAIDRGNRIVLLQSFIQRYAPNPSMPESLSGMQIGKQLIDWNAVLRSFNKVYDEGVQSNIEQRKANKWSIPHMRFVKKLREHQSADPSELVSVFRWRGRHAAGQRFGEDFAYRVYPDVSSLWYIRLEILMQRNLARLGLALVEYRAENSDFPDSLDQLVPRYMPMVLDDPVGASSSSSAMSGFQYGREGGRAWLASVGFDGKRNSEGEKSDDAVLWVAPPVDVTESP